MKLFAGLDWSVDIWSLEFHFPSVGGHFAGQINACSTTFPPALWDLLLLPLLLLPPDHLPSLHLSLLMLLPFEELSLLDGDLIPLFSSSGVLCLSLSDADLGDLGR